MLKHLGVLREVLRQKDTHPLADPRELARAISELPADHPYKALDEIVAWLESMQGEGDLTGDSLFAATRQLDEAARTPLRLLARDYLTSARLLQAEEKRLWTICHGFHLLMSQMYERCLQTALQKNKATESLHAALPLIAARLVASLGSLLKWQQFQYGHGQLEGAIWKRLGQAVMATESNGLADKVLALYANQPGMTTPQYEFVKVVAFQAASMDSLLPLEIEVAERLISHVLAGFVISARPDEHSVYWLDLAEAQVPQRLARLPKGVSPGLRFFKPAGAHAQIEDLLRRIEISGDVPAEVQLGEQYPARLVVSVLRHLAAYLAPVPPQRSHVRHQVKHRMTVLHGLDNVSLIFSGGLSAKRIGAKMESWVVENVSRGGFGALLNNVPAEWLKVGTLIAMQPEGGDNWLPGIVRRFRRESETETKVGIQTLAQQVSLVELKPRTLSSFAATSEIHALLIQDAADEVRLILPAASFDLREKLELNEVDRQELLLPVALLEQTSDYEVARYRVQPA